MLRAVLAVAVLAFSSVLAVAASARVPSDPQGSHPAYAQLNLPSAWDTTTGSSRVIVAVVDTGVDALHPELAGAVLPGYDFVERDQDPSDPPSAGHGTAVAGAVAAHADNGIGGIGACFRCSVMPLRVIGLDGIALNASTAEAIDYAVDHGAAIVNASLYGPNVSTQLRDAITRARAAGVLVVAAAGNEGNAVPQYPAAFEGVIAVAAAAGSGDLARFSSRGPWVDVAAPECAPVPVLGGGTGIGCMTSVSSPLVAGIVALMRTQAPFAGAEEIEDALTSSGRPVAGTRAGLIDAAAALRALGEPGPRLRPSVLGRAAVGEELEAFSGVWSGSGLDVSYRWERCRGGSCSPIPGATGATYEPGRLDAGLRLRVLASTGGAQTAFSALTRAVQMRPRPLEPPSISGVARVGRRLAANRGRWEGTDLRFEVRWQRCGVRCIPVAAGTAYRLRVGDRDSRLRLEVTAYNTLGVATALSRRTAVVR